MLTTRSRRAALCVALIASSASAGQLEGRPGSPGSLLVFSEFDNRQGTSTVVRVTNTRTEAGPASWIRARFVYVDEGCGEFERSEYMTHGDTFPLITAYHNPIAERGFLYVFAEHSATHEPIVFDHLVGSALVVDGFTSRTYGYNASAFQGVGDEGSATDLDGDGRRDLDGAEYTGCPDRLVFSGFLGSEDPRGNEIVLLSLSGGSGFSTEVVFDVRNDNGELVRAKHAFHCWEHRSLESISRVFTNAYLQTLPNDPQETLGADTIESGWFVLDGLAARSPQVGIPDPAVLALLIEVVGTPAAQAPFWIGSQANGELRAELP